MSVSTVPDKFARKFARAMRFEKIAYGGMILAIVLLLVSGLFGVFWIAALAIAIGTPSAWLLDITCYQCFWPAHALFGTAKGWAAKDQMFAPGGSKHVWRLQAKCSKCGANFVGQSEFLDETIQ